METKKRILEVCCADLQSVRAAVDGGAQRVELCQALELGGVTPSVGMIEFAVGLGIRTHVLIRPRGGDFVYSPDEVQCMERDINMAREAGAAGVVIGALTVCGDIDTDVSQQLVAQAQGMSVTFHRAFDDCRNPHEALRQIIAMGCDRLLTSGQADDAVQGIPLLSQLVNEAGGRMVILPGCGVTPANARLIMQRTGTHELHGSLRSNGHTDAGLVRRTLEAMSY